VVFGALATKREDLDARLVLNAAEGAALGIAWFLALHMLQPAERRQVLVLDDPVSLFDGPNLAAFISTLRAYARLTKPEQVVIATHDDVVAAMLAEELSPIEGWPESVSLLRCERDRNDRSVIRVQATPEQCSSFEHEIEQLALDHAPA
jgi:wobble nucleotide-excising tRNase